MITELLNAVEAKHKKKETPHFEIGDTVDVVVTVAELIPEKFRARLTCICSVDGEVVLDGEAWVKVPSKKAGGRPLPRV